MADIVRTGLGRAWSRTLGVAQRVGWLAHDGQDRATMRPMPTRTAPGPEVPPTAATSLPHRDVSTQVSALAQGVPRVVRLDLPTEVSSGTELPVMTQKPIPPRPIDNGPARGLADHRATGRIGLALGSGAGRGWAHIGVLKALAKAGIKPDIVVGTSIGAVVGGCHVAGELDAIEHFARSLTRRSVLSFLDITFSGAGLISGNKLVAELDTRLSHFDIERLETKFIAVATEIGTGQEIWLSRGRLVDAMRASYAMPGIFKPVEMGGRWLFDGALVNPVPVSVARALGARYVIAVNLNTDMSGRGSFAPIEVASEPSAQPPPGEAARESVDDGVGRGSPHRQRRSLRKLVQRQLFGEPQQGPSITTVMSEAMNIVQDRIARSRLAGDPPDAVIGPRLGDFGLFDFHRADALIALGEQAAERALDDIRREIAVRRACGILA